MSEDDIPRLAAVLGWPLHGLRHRWQAQLAGEREMLVAFVDDVPVGAVSIEYQSDVPGFLHLFALDVAEAHRRRGIGTHLVERVEQEALTRGDSGVYLEVALTNVDARRLYERLSYVVSGEPFEKGWNPPREDGTPGEWESDIVQRMFKHFAKAR